ncbi:DUF2335 domain-containing protein [Paracoccus contaminans]|uniref:DUF2335 domain-containing protein n=1 Tax=Paracoccus contaminans TaxID=1945662 RepID=A0A1W6CX45_9RHOB|nr:DUF2335 domain-containing protein [Paracoccus contaminans]ARJ69395.1 hypothetical protein B0A89_06895 [Paracoccus contaminans]
MSNKVESDQSAKLPQNVEDVPVDELIDRLPPDTPKELIAVLERTAVHSGPIPSPDALRGYEQVYPGAAHRIFDMAEREQQIRCDDNKHVNWNDTFKIAASVVVSLGLVGAGLTCAFIDQPWLGGVLGTSGIVSGIIQAYLRRGD